MASRPKLPIETEARNAYFRDDGHRAWALVAFMVEHEYDDVELAGATQKRPRDAAGRPVFRGTELSRQLFPAGAGYGGYYAPAGAGSSRTDLLRMMAAKAEQAGWITRERQRYGGFFKYALTMEGRNLYRDTIKPERAAFVESYVITTIRAVNAAVTATSQSRREAFDGDLSNAILDNTAGTSRSPRRRHQPEHDDDIPRRRSIDRIRDDVAVEQAVRKSENSLRLASHETDRN
jgi:hypothetical protein